MAKKHRIHDLLEDLVLMHGWAVVDSMLSHVGYREDLIAFLKEAMDEDLEISTKDKALEIDLRVSKFLKKAIMVLGGASTTRWETFTKAIVYYHDEHPRYKVN